MARSAAASRHGVLVVHGQEDEASHGEMIATVCSPILEALRDAGTQVSATLSIVDSGAEGSLDVTWQDPERGTRQDRFELREAFWNDAFSPPPADTVIAWVTPTVLGQVRAVLRGWSRPSFEPQGVQRSEGKPLGETALGQFAYGTVIILLYAVGTLTLVPAYVGALLLYQLARIPVLGTLGLKKVNNFLAANVNPFMSRVLGDTQRYVEDEFWASNARRRVESAASALLADDSIEDLMILGYSAGTTVVIDALRRGGGVETALEAREPLPVTLVTVGSALNRLDGFAHASRTSAGRRFTTQKMSPALVRKSFNWVDIHARFDYVAGGGLDKAAKAMAPAGTAFSDRLVVNRDSLLQDHFGYFTNRDLVVPRLIGAMYRAYEDGDSSALDQRVQARRRSPVRVSRAVANRRVNRAAVRLLGTVAFLGIAAVVVITALIRREARLHLAALAEFIGDLLAPIAKIPLLNHLADVSGLADRAASHPHEFGAVAAIILAYLASTAQHWVSIRLLDAWNIEFSHWDRAVYLVLLASSVVAPALTVWWLVFR